MKLAIVTACPSGIANSIIVAGLMEKVAKELSWDINIECHTSVSPIQSLTEAQIEVADCIIICSNTEIDNSRFTGKKVYQSSITECLNDAKAYLQNATQQAITLTTATSTNKNVASDSKKIVAITACPTGVAHTFMVATALEEEGKRLGYSVKVETRGSVGAKNQLTAEDISEADLVIIATDIEVDLARFAGKKLYKTSTGLALKKTNQEITNAFEKATVYQNQGAKTENKTEEKSGVYKHLMTGVSHMLPVVVAGGLLIALSFVFGIEAFKEEGTMARP
ncbi:PTS fructose-like transporter subunit IIB [Psychromonas sp. KJ10-10]|uniref:PTS fructose-like transporter subunit IIB n=1 Tax=Psychromonas sp. KJ10-10 TaxID=3391823 RepID=UPI0039B65A7A